jgi:ACS family hexuronate transporter-like MFS transporter
MSLFLNPERRRWFIIAIIFLVIVFNYLDRQILSILKPLLKKEFDLGDDGYALIVNIFTISYALMYPVSGWLVDRIGARKMMFIGVITWSLASIGGGIARTFAQFGFFRSLLGLAEPTSFPAQVKVITIWFSGKLRATANSLCVAGSSIGAIIAPPFIAWLALSLNWRAAFIIPGLIGLFLALIWWLIYRDPPQKIAQEATSLTDSPTTEAFTWGQLWSRRSLWGILLIRFISDPVWYFCLFWLPGFLQEESGLTLAQLGMIGWIPFLIANIGGIGSSAWSDLMVRHGSKPLRARKIMLTFVAFFAPLVLLPHQWGIVITLIKFSVIAAVALSWLFTLSVVIAETFPVKNVASVLGICGGVGAVGAVLFNYLIGHFMGSIGPEWIFIVMSVIHPLVTILLWTMVRPEIPSKNKSYSKLQSESLNTN